MPEPPATLVEFPADDPERALRFWSSLLGVELEPRTAEQGQGWEVSGTQTPIGVHARGRGPGDTASLPYFSIPDMQAALAQVTELGGTVVHPGSRWSICRDSEGTPFGLSQGGDVVAPSPA